MVRSKLCARTVPTESHPSPARRPSGADGLLIKQQPERCYRCQLIEKVARFIVARRHCPLFQPHCPRRNRYAPIWPAAKRREWMPISIGRRVIITCFAQKSSLGNLYHQAPRHNLGQEPIEFVEEPRCIKGTALLGGSNRACRHFFGDTVGKRLKGL